MFRYIMLPKEPREVLLLSLLINLATSERKIIKTQNNRILRFEYFSRKGPVSETV